MIASQQRDPRKESNMPGSRYEWQKVTTTEDHFVIVQKLGFGDARMITDAPKGEYGEYEIPRTDRARRTKRTTLDRRGSIRLSNRTRKQQRQYSDPTGRSVLRYTTG
jgi:hypothetical protein